MATPQTSRPALAPAPVSFIDQIRIAREPRGLIGRYFLSTERLIQDFGLTASLRPIAELATIHGHYAESWNGLVPVLDTDEAPIPDHTAAALVVYDRAGDVVSCDACRLLDLGATSAHAAAHDLTFFYGDAAPGLRDKRRCEATAPTMAKLSGRLVYHGGFWVRPDHRRSGLGNIVRDLCRFWAFSQWDYTYEVSVGAPAFRDEALRVRYGFTIGEPALTFYVNGATVMKDGLFLAVSNAGLLDRLERLVAERDAAVVDDRDVQRVASR